MNKKTFLVEIGTEELPPKTLRTLAECFADNFTSEIKRANFKYGAVTWFATPRRLAIKVAELSTSGNDYIIEKRGPTINQSFDITGQPSKSAKKWAHECGITVNQAQHLITEKGKWLLYRTKIKGQPIQKLLANMVKTALYKLPISKKMRWGDMNAQFVRPVHTVTMLLGIELIPGNVLGIDSARTIRGHRFMGEKEFILDDADHYPKVLLERGKVIADYEVRKTLIKRNAMIAAEKIGGQVELNENLLEEVTSMVEWPVVLSAKFEEKFLIIPSLALVYIMKVHQKYFPIYGSKGNLLSHFIFVTNIESKDTQQIISGNEKVVRPRLADAEFFFNIDRKRSLEDYLPRLKNVIYQKKLGSMHDKTHRIQRLTEWVASQIGANVNYASRAGLLSKCDLMTNMVFEFSDTQGIIGMYYARYDNEVEDVAIALNEQYQPRHATDKLPQSLVGCALAIAEKMDTLIGIFGIGQYPKGDKDPFALRRAAIGVLRIIIEKKLPLDLQIIANKAMFLYDSKLTNIKVVDEVVEFILGRFLSWYQETGYATDSIQSVLVCRPTKPVDFDVRVKAVTHFRTLKEASAVIAANKRISNILAKSIDKLNDDIQDSILQETAEIKLAQHLMLLRKKLKLYFINGNYQEALIELATLREPIDAFFENVMVMVKEDVVRVNRLTLLSKLHELFLQVADVSILQ